ncbi:MAG: PAP/fibrillin family protein [Cyanobacteria bacterium J06635_15]
MNSQERIEAKQALREALAAHGGDPHNPVVMTAIAHLATLNPTPAPAHNTDLLDGNWRLISAPSFPDGEQRADGTYVYTLGRLAFNMFQPKDLKVLINQVSQPVFPIDAGVQRTHDIVVDFSTLNEEVSPLRGVVRNLGICEPSSDTALRVWFTGGVLEPATGQDLQEWQSIFGDPTAPSRSSSLGEWFQGLFLKIMFGLVPPEGMATDTGRVEFQMTRSPKGILTLLYLDDELRITQGQKETVLVCERY